MITVANETVGVDPALNCAGLGAVAGPSHTAVTSPTAIVLSPEFNFAARSIVWANAGFATILFIAEQKTLQAFPFKLVIPGLSLAQTVD